MRHTFNTPPTKPFRAAALAAVVGLTLAASGAGSPAKAESTFLRIGGGIGGSSWEVTAGKAADMFSKAGDDIQAIAQPGNMGENLARLRRGEADIGVTYGFVFRGVGKGEGEFAKLHDPNLRLLAALYPSYEQPLVRKDAPWTTISEYVADPAAIKAAVLTPGSGTYIMGNAMLTAAGASIDDIKAAGGLALPLNYAQGVDGLRTGQVNMLAVNGPPKHPKVIEFQDQGRLLTIDDAVLQKVLDTLPGAAAVTLPQDTYDFLDAPYKTFAVYTSLVISKDVPDDVVYRITKHFWENIDEFRSVAGYAQATDVNSAAVGAKDLPVHPGALKYYKEVGAVK